MAEPDSTVGEVFEISAGGVTARVARKGAELVSWCVDGRELLWQGDPRSWHEQSPVLFPVVGWTRNGEARVHGKTFPLALHGFARHRHFVLVSRGPDRVTLALQDDDTTRALYPFAFTLTLTYSVGADGLLAEAEVVNAGDEPMPYALGLHPGFRWPIGSVPAATDLASAQAGHWIEFDEPERAEVPVIAPGGLLSTRRRPVPLEGRTLSLDPALFSGDALIFENAASRTVRFQNHRETLQFTFGNLPTLVLWMRPGAAFLCIEGWCGSGDPEGFEGDLFEKPGMTVLQRGASGRHSMRFQRFAAM
jgi:galactose mutarotase-like enzyme